MSRLNFVERAYSDASSDDEVAKEQQAEILPSAHISSTMEDEQSSSSSTQYTLDVEDAVSVEETACEVTTQKKKKKRKKKKSTATTTAEAVEVSIPGTDINPSVQLTGWLTSFLSKKRTFEICPPPEIELSNDTYLKQFNSEFTLPAHALEDTSDMDSDSDEEQVIGETTVEPSAGTDCDIAAVCDDVFEIKAESDTAIAQPAGPSKLSFYNLPYSITAEEVCMCLMFVLSCFDLSVPPWPAWTKDRAVRRQAGSPPDQCGHGF